MHVEGVTCANCCPKMNPGWPTVPFTVPVTYQPVGWLCPKCGTVNNPSMPSCFECKPDQKTEK